jgi:hypothetical protein
MGSNATVGLGMYPAKYSFNISSANCGTAAQPDYVVFNTSLMGLSNQASILAYDNLYTGCSGTAPSTYWAYNTGGTDRDLRCLVLRTARRWRSRKPVRAARRAWCS